MIDWLLPLFPLLPANNCFSLSAAAEDIALFFMFIFAISLAFFIIAPPSVTLNDAALLPIIIGWFVVVGLALGHAQIDERWLLPAVDEFDETEDGVDGRLTADVARPKFNDCGRGAILPLLFDISKPPFDLILLRSSLLLPTLLR